MNPMPIDHIPDWEQRLARQDAFWDREIIDRPVVVMSLPKRKPVCPYPTAKNWSSERERWMDTQYRAEWELAHALNTEYLGDALPSVWPNLGPEVLSAFFGLDMDYSDRTSWSVPNLLDWRDADSLQFSEDNFYWKKLVELTDALMDVGSGCFFTGMTDLHPGGDAIAAFRGPEELAVDMIEHIDDIKALLPRIEEVYFRVYDFWYDRLTAAGQPITTWNGMVSTRKWYLPSNDFSCMIASEMFDDVFLPGIARECRFLENSIYHLDGPGALRHLDSLLAIEELDAVQWVYGAGRGPASNWMDVYKRCRAAGKGLQLRLQPGELDLFMEALRPGGLWIQMEGVKSREEAEAILARVSKWR